MQTQIDVEKTTLLEKKTHEKNDKMGGLIRARITKKSSLLSNEQMPKRKNIRKNKDKPRSLWKESFY